MKINNISVEDLGQINVRNENYESIRLSDLWKNTKAVLVFVRHFG